MILLFKFKVEAATALNVIVSLAASPKVIFPFAVVFPESSTKKGAVESVPPIARSSVEVRGETTPESLCQKPAEEPPPNAVQEAPFQT